MFIPVSRSQQQGRGHPSLMYIVIYSRTSCFYDPHAGYDNVRYINAMAVPISEAPV